MPMETMSNRLGKRLREARGDETRADFARRLSLSYTYVRALELGLRSPSDGVLAEITRKLGLDSGELILAAYCDRSERLTQVLIEKKVVEPETEDPQGHDDGPTPTSGIESPRVETAPTSTGATTGL